MLKKKLNEVVLLVKVQSAYEFTRHKSNFQKKVIFKKQHYLLLWYTKKMINHGFVIRNINS